MQALIKEIHKSGLSELSGLKTSTCYRAFSTTKKMNPLSAAALENALRTYLEERVTETNQLLDSLKKVQSYLEAA
jgi:hypothetical protein